MSTTSNRNATARWTSRRRPAAAATAVSRSTSATRTFVRSRQWLPVGGTCWPFRTGRQSIGGSSFVLCSGFAVGRGHRRVISAHLVGAASSAAGGKQRVAKFANGHRLGGFRRCRPLSADSAGRGSAQLFARNRAPMSERMHPLRPHTGTRSQSGAVHHSGRLQWQVDRNIPVRRIDDIFFGWPQLAA